MGTSGSERCVSDIWRLEPPKRRWGIRGPQSRGPGSTPTPGQPGESRALGVRGPHLSGRDPEGLGDLSVELADVGEALDLARGAAMCQLRTEDEARAGAGRSRGLGGRGRGRGRAWSLGPWGLAGRCALHGRRSSATRATAFCRIRRFLQPPLPRPRARQRRQPSCPRKGIQEPEPPGKVTPRDAGGRAGLRCLGPAGASCALPGDVGQSAGL